MTQPIREGPPTKKSGGRHSPHPHSISHASKPLNTATATRLQARERVTRSQRRQRYCARIWPLGDRGLFELVDHIARKYGLDDELDHLLDRFAGLDPDVLKALRAGRLQPSPLHLVGTGR